MVGALAALPLSLCAQDSPPQESNAPSVFSAYTITDRSANQRIWTRVIAKTNQVSRIIPAVTNQQGQVTPAATNQTTAVTYRTNHVVEMASGMNHTVNGNWIDSADDIQVTADGGAATNGQHQVFFAANINTAGSIRFVTSEGQTLRSHILCLAYFDPVAGTNVVLSDLQDRTGQIVGTNQVIYTNAFTNLNADVRYVNSIAGFEQDVILREQLVSPESCGLSSQTTRLQVWTEFLDSPVPQITPGQDGDQILGFGSTLFQEGGKAFFIGNESTPVPVRKQWGTTQGRTFLVEEVQFSAIASQLANLPPRSGGNRGGGGGQAMQRNQWPPAPKLANHSTGGLKLASAPFPPQKGLVLDYESVSTTTNQTFKGDTTYYVSSNVTLSGTTTLEGGAVVKFANSTNAKITLSGLLLCQTSPYRPAILTSVDDNSVGEAIGSGSPANTGATFFSAQSGQTNEYKYLRMSYAGTAITNTMAATVWHSQFLHCTNGVGAGSSNVTLRNVLMSQVTNCTYTTGATFAEHLTADRCSKFDGATPSSASLTNCLLSSVTTQPAWTSVTSSVTNGSGLYQTVGGGNYYLANGSTNRNAGNTNINSTLASDLKKMTTYPPSDQGSVSIGADTTWSTNVWRDTDIPDRGYHYDPLDYLVSSATVGDSCNDPLTFNLTNYVAVGVYGTTGFSLGNDVAFNSQGLADKLNRIVFCANVQEQGQTADSFFAIPVGDICTPGLNLFCRFTDVAAVGTQGWLLTAVADGDSGNNNAFGSWSMVNSMLRGLYFQSHPYMTAAAVDMGFTNCLFERGGFEVGKSSGANPYVTLALNLHDNLFWRGSVNLVYDESGSDANWEFQDNAFDNNSLSASGSGFGDYGVISNNGYVNTSSPFGEGGAVSIGSFNYANGPMGLFYQSSTDFVDHGHATADAIGYFHYTTQASQVREGFTTMDIGFHYVAVDGNGNPIDGNSDGTPDYVQDTNGNGWVDGGESNYMITLTNAPGITGLIVFTPLK